MKESDHISKLLNKYGLDIVLKHDIRTVQMNAYLSNDSFNKKAS